MISTGRRRKGLNPLVVLAATVTSGLVLGVGAAGAATPAPSRTVLSASSTTIGLGQSAKLKAVVKAVVGTGKPTGSVTFSEGATVWGTAPLTLVGSTETAKLTVTGLTVGNHDMTATYTGSPAFAGSTSLPLTVTVGLPATTTSVFLTNPGLVPGATAKLKASVKVLLAGAGTPSGDVSFDEGTTHLGTAPLALVGTVWSAKLSVPGLSIGTHQITARYAGSSTLAGSTSQPLAVVVSKGATTCTLTPTAQGGGAYSIQVAVKPVPPASGSPTGLVTFVVDGSAPQTFALNGFARASLSATVSVGDSHTVTVSYSGDSQFAASTGTLTFTG